MYQGYEPTTTQKIVNMKFLFLYWRELQRTQIRMRGTVKNMCGACFD